MYLQLCIYRIIKKKKLKVLKNARKIKVMRMKIN